MKILLKFFLILASSFVFASEPLTATLEEMATAADHIMIVRVIDVDMIDEQGRKIEDPRAMTGPGLKNLIRLHVKIEKVLQSKLTSVPKTLYIPLDPFMHYSLGSVKKAELPSRGSFLVLLKGDGFSPIKPGVFSRPLSDKAEALRLYKLAHR